LPSSNPKYADYIDAKLRNAGDQGTVYRESLPSAGAGAVEWRTSAAESMFVRVEIRHPDGHMAALSNPVILT
jgi:hypothetical protein